MGARSATTEAIREALRDATASVCIMIRGANDVVHEVVAVPVSTSPLSYVVEGPGFRHHGLSEQDAVKADACALCEVLWLDGLEVAGLSHTPPDREDLVALALTLLSSDQMQPAL